MSLRVRHQKILNPPAVSTLENDVDGVDWNAEHLVDAPGGAPGGIVIVDPADPSHLTTLPGGPLGYVLQGQGVDQAPAWAPITLDTGGAPLGSVPFADPGSPTDVTWLPPGAPGQYLTTLGAGAAPHWTAWVLELGVAPKGSLLFADASRPQHYDWLPPGVSGRVLTSGGLGTPPSWLPAAPANLFITQPGDLITGDAGGLPVRLPRGLTDQVLTVLSSGLLAWATPAGGGTLLPPGEPGALVVYSGPASLEVLPPGAEGELLTIDGGGPAWKPPIATGMTNPMVTTGDLIYGGPAGSPQRLPIHATTGFVLTVNAGYPDWGPGVPHWYQLPGNLLMGSLAGTPQILPRGAATQVLAVAASGLLEWVTPASGGTTNPMTTPADLIVGGVAGAPTRLGVGADTQVLTVVAGALAWQAPASGGMTNPMTAPADLIVGGVAGAAQRLGVGADTQVLTVVGGLPAWATPVSGGMTNPMTSLGDLIVGGASGAPIRLSAGANLNMLTTDGESIFWSTGLHAVLLTTGALATNFGTGPALLAIGATGDVLTVAGGVPTWMPLPVDPGFANPMTGIGDMIRGTTGGAAVRLAPGSNGQVLTIASGSPAWQTLPVDPGFANPMTSVGDLIVGGASGAPGRLATGAAGTVLVGGASPSWSAFPVLTNLGLTGFTQGSVVFIGLGGFLAQDNADFFWDDTANALRLFGGVMGTAGARILTLGQGSFPSSRPADSVQMLVQDLFGAGTAGLTIVPEGAGSFLFGGTTVDSIFQLTNSPVTLRLSATTAMASVGPSTAHPLGFITNNAQRMVIDQNGLHALGGSVNTPWLSTIYPTASQNGLIVVSASAAGGGRNLLQITRVGGTQFYVDDHANSPIGVVIGGLFRTLAIGATDSGGAGYRMVRIAN